MKQGSLSEYFKGIAAKPLSMVEADFSRSHQHEFNGVGKLKELFGLDRQELKAQFLYFSDDDSEPIQDIGTLTWYDSRINNPKRAPEYRLYFTDTMVTQNMAAGDLLFIALKPDHTVLVIVAESESTISQQLLWLFGLNVNHPGYSVKGELESDQIKLEFTSKYILEKIGIEVKQSDESYLEQMIHKFGTDFPTTTIFSEFSRSTVSEISASDLSDEALLAWVEREEILFRTFEKHLLGDRLQKGFYDVDDFMKLSLSVQNRRKSRAGQSLENHLAYLFLKRGVAFSRTGATEGKSKPDFLFPSIENYHNQFFPVEHLTMLGVKTTCKDRWRQVLSEADRIERKHLFTLEPSISENQTNEMQSRSLQLVLPKRLHNTYKESQRNWLFSLEEFLAEVQEKQEFINQ